MSIKFKRLVACLLSGLLLAESCPLGAFAAEAADEEQFRAELAASVSAEEYPDGLFDFLTARMQTAEDIASADICIIRRGNTEKAASVVFKAVDVSAEYGVDYRIELEDGLLDIPVEKNPDAEMFIHALDIDPQSEDELMEDAALAEAALNLPLFDDPESGAEYAVGMPEAPFAEAEDEDEEAYDGSLAGVYRLATGNRLPSFDWRNEDKASEAAFAEAAAEMYDEIVGHEITLDFAPGEYQKVLRFICLDDAVSEDEEQVLFILSGAEGCALTDNPTGFMNIVDDEEPEEMQYAFAFPSYRIPNGETEVEVELRRTAGIFRYDSVAVVSAMQTAVVGKHYDPVTEYVTFVPGQTSKKFTVSVKEHPAFEAVSFTVLARDHEASAEIVIDPLLSQSNGTQVEVLGDGTARLLENASEAHKTFRFSSLTASDRSAFTASGSYLKFNNRSCTFGGSNQLDLTMAESIDITHYEDGIGTRYTYETGGCNSTTKTAYHTDKYNRIDINGRCYLSRNGTFSSTTEHLTLDDGARTENATITLSSLGRGSCKDTNGVFTDAFQVNYKPFVIDVGSSDDDAMIEPMIWYSTERAPTGSGREFKAGTLRLADGSTSDIYYGNTDITFYPQWSEKLKSEDLDGIYLWGVKIERIGSGSGRQYYYLHRNTVNLKQLYLGNYCDFYTGTRIEPYYTLLTFKQSDGSTYDGYRILPVYRQKTAYTRVHFGADGGVRFATDSFKADTVAVTGRLDTLVFDTVSYGESAVGGWQMISMNPGDKTATSYADEQTYFADNTLRSYMKDKKDEDNLYKKHVAAGDRAVDELYTEKWRNESAHFMYNYGEAVPGKLEYTPCAMFNYLEPTLMMPTITVTVNPAAAATFQSAGKIFYLPEDGSDGQYAEYTGKLPNGLLDGKPIEIAPYELKNYPLTAVYTAEPPENTAFKTKWIDFTGDTDRDGRLTDEELGALGQSAKELYRDMRMTYVGNVFNYQPLLVGQSVVYYNIGLEEAAGPDNACTLGGYLYLRGRSVYENDTAGSVYTQTPVEGATIRVGELSAVTDSNGYWSISSAYFRANEVYSVSIGWLGRLYSAAVAVNQELPMYIYEYDTFDLYGLSVRVDEQEIAIFPSVEIGNEESLHRYAFRIRRKVNGIEPQTVTAERYSIAGEFRMSYEVRYDPASDEWVLRSQQALEQLASGDADYSINTNAEPNLAAGDYYVIHITDNRGMTYIPHTLGIKTRTALSYVNIANSFVPPRAGLVLDLIDKVDAAFDLGLTVHIPPKQTSRTVFNIDVVDKDIDGTTHRTITWGLTPGDRFKSKYKPKGDKKTTGDEAVKEDIRQAASDVEDASEKPLDEQSAEEKAEGEQKREDAKEAIEGAVDKDTKNKKRGKFAANLTLCFDIGVSLQFGYHEAATPEEQSGWYFEEFLVVGTVRTIASVSYSYMTPIGVAIGVQARLNGDVSAAFGFNAYYADPSNPEYMYVEGEAGTVDLAALGNRSADRKLDVYGKLMLRPNVSLSVMASLVSPNVATVSLVGGADFDMNFTTGRTGSGYVTLSAKLRIGLLFNIIRKEWTIASKKYEMFKYGNEGELLDALNERDLRYEPILPEDIVSGYTASAWNGSRTTDGEAVLSATKLFNEHILMSGMNFESEPILEAVDTSVYYDDEDDPQYGGVRALLVFLDVKDEDSDVLVLKYSMLIGNDWTEPTAFDPSSKGDDAHAVCRVGEDKLMVAWSTYHGSVGEMTPSERLACRDINTVMFDKKTATFGPIRALTRSTVLDDYADTFSDIVYREKADGSQQMIAVFRKNAFDEYSAASNPSDPFSELYVGDVVNSLPIYAYRVYDFEKDDWDDRYLGGIDFSLTDDPEGYEEEYFANFYGQQFLDAANYAYVRGAEVYEEAVPSDVRGAGVWKKLPEASDIGVADIGNSMKVLEHTADTWGRYGVLTYLVDFDGSETSVDDREIFLQLYDFDTSEMLLPTRLTYNATTEMNLVLTHMKDALRLYYVDDGSIVSLDLSRLIESGVFAETPDEGERCFLENRMEKEIVPLQTILAAEAVTDENTSPKRYAAFSVDYRDDIEILFYTEPGVTYKDGIKATDPEAALPENRFSERQIYSKFHFVRGNRHQLTDEKGEPIWYPEFDEEGNRIDYDKVPDLTGSTGVVKAGDPVTVISYTDEWMPYIRLTDERGANFDNIDFIYDDALNVCGVYEKTYSVLKEVDGMTVAAPDEDDRQMIVAEFDLYNTELTETGLDITVNNIDQIGSYTGEFPMDITLEDPYYITERDIVLRALLSDGEDEYKVVAETEIDEVESYGKRYVTLRVPLPEELHGMKLRLEAVTTDGSIEGTYEYAYADPQTLMITNVYQTRLDRENVRYAVTVANTSAQKLYEQTVRAELNGETSFETEPFTIGGNETMTVYLDVYVPDGSFTETREDGIITETAHLRLYTDADSVEDDVVRSGAAVYEEMLAGAVLTDFVTGKTLDGTLTLLPDGYALLSAQTAAGDAGAMMIRVVSGNDKVAAADALGGVRAVRSGSAKVKVYVAPNVSGYMATLADSSELYAYNDFNTLPSALVKEIGLNVKVTGGHVSSSDHTVSAGKTPVTEEEKQPDPKKLIILTVGSVEATVFGEKVINDVAPVIRADRTMLPARFVAEALGAKVEWRETGVDTGIVTITREDVTVVLTIGSDKATVNGETITLDSPAFIENDRTYLPLRFLAETLGAKVEWRETGVDAGVVTIIAA